MPLAGTAPPATLADNFTERAMELVCFMIERHGSLPSVRQCEQDVGDWITRWRRKEARRANAAQHFESTELGIILRVLNGPNATGPGFEESANQQLCWLVARCLSQQP